MSTPWLTGIFRSYVLRNSGNRVLNYVWINERPDDPNEETGPLCSVPLHYLDRAFKNARRYPDAEVRLWVDMSMLNDMSRYFLNNHVYSYAPPNVKMHDLHDIPAYHESSVFKAHEDVKIFMRVDIARLMALSHCFDDNQKTTTVFYADFDVKDVALDKYATWRALNKYGISAGFDGEEGLENSYIAVNRRNQSFLQEIINITVNAAFSERNGFLIYKNKLRENFFDGGPHFEMHEPKEIVARRLWHEFSRKNLAAMHVSYDVVPPSKLYTDLNLCPEIVPVVNDEEISPWYKKIIGMPNI